MILQFRMDLVGAQPKVWRRVLVRPNMRLDKFLDLVYHLFDMDPMYHLGHIEAEAGSGWGARSPRFMYPEQLRACFGDGVDASKHTLATILDGASSLRVVYDYGDDWNVKIVLEKELEDDDPSIAGKRVPSVLKGKGSGIIDDIGGVGMLNELAYILTHRSEIDEDELAEFLDDYGFEDVEDFAYILEFDPDDYKNL